MLSNQPRHVDETAHRRIVQRVIHYVTDEPAVDLQHVDFQGSEVAKRRRIRAEVFQRDLHAQGTHLFDEHRGVGHVGDGRRLGNLQADALADASACGGQGVEGVAVLGTVADRLAGQIAAKLAQQSQVGHPDRLRAAACQVTWRTTGKWSKDLTRFCPNKPAATIHV